MGPERPPGGDGAMAEVNPDPRSTRAVDPRALRVAVVPGTAAEVAPVVLEPQSGGRIRVDGASASIHLERRDPAHAILVDTNDAEARRTSIVMLPSSPTPGGTVRREVIVDGWRIVVEIEPEQRATLRERARRGRDETAGTGRSELHAVIPGRIVAVSVAPGDRVTAGQQVMVVEAMKMQNELRAPRDGIVGRVEVGAGSTVELGDLLLVLE